MRHFLLHINIHFYIPFRAMPASEEMPYRETPHTAAGKDYFPNRLPCDPVRDRVSTRTSSSMR